MNTVEIIRKKRDGGELNAEELSYFIKGYLHDEIADYQMAAFLMAGFLCGFTDAETQALTEEMLYSGDVLDFSYLPEAKIDKHSTGGVGDKTSLVLAPIAAAAGLRVPMISGRALGHTGGTLDKLDAIPGFNVGLTLPEFKKVVEDVGAAIIGQTEQIAPADKRVYAMRDLTATIDSIPLITASIMSKKLAEGLDALVLDVKCGSGAFMKTQDQARKLAQSMVNTGKLMRKRVAAVITDMNQPLGWAVGNSLEVIESIEMLQGKGKGDFLELCKELSAVMLQQGHLVETVEQGRELTQAVIDDGRALEKFRAMVAAQGGDEHIVDDIKLLPQAQNEQVVTSQQDGFIEAIDTQAVGHATMHLGAGRRRIDSIIDYAVGVRIHAKIGDEVKVGDELCTIYYNDANFLPMAKIRLENAFQFGMERPAPVTLVKEMIS